MPRRTVFQAFAEFFRDLLAGDPVALGIALGFVGFWVILGLIGAQILRARKREAEKHRQKIYGKYKKVKPDKER